MSITCFPVTISGYVIEVFIVPSVDSKRYAIFDKVSIIDLTQYKRTDAYTDEQVIDILRYFNSLALNANGDDGLASRDSSISEECFETSGGSRLNYRYHAQWAGLQNDFAQHTLIDF